MENGRLRRDDVLAEPAWPGRRAEHLLVGTMVDLSAPAIAALAARPLGIHHHPIARVEVGHGVADRYDLAGYLVPQDHRRDPVGVGPVETVHLRTAHTDRFDLDQDLVGSLDGWLWGLGHHQVPRVF